MKKALFKPDTLFIIGLALAVFAAFAPGLSCGFLVNWDDGAHVAINPDIALTAENFAKYFFGTVVDLYIPLPMYSFMLEHALFGDNPFWYHLDNILLHCACAVLFYLILRRFAVKGAIAFLCACVWAISPQKVESVVWITERKDLLCALFSLVSFYTFMKAFSKDKMSWAAGIFAALAMLCKPAMAALPGVMILYAICLRKNRMKPTEYIRILVFPILASAAALLWSMHVTAGTRPFGLETDIFVPLHNLLWYFMTSFIPYELNPIYPVLEGFKDCVIPLAGTVLLLALLVYGSRKIKMPWILITGFTLAAGGIMLPVAGFMKYGHFQYCDRYTYFVSWVLYAWLAVILSKLIRRHVFNIKMTSAALACWGLVFFAATWLYIPSWENEKVFAGHVLSSPGHINLQAFGLLGEIALDSGNIDLIRQFLSRIENDREYYAADGHGVTIDAFLYSFRGCIALAERRNADAIRDCRIALGLFNNGKVLCQPPLFRRLLIIMAPVFYITGEKEKVVAISKALKNLELKDGLPPAHGIYAMAFNMEKNYPALLKELDAMLKDDPDNKALKAKYEAVKTMVNTK